MDSIIAWRDGKVDLNGDGDLDDEYIEQPVAAQKYDPATNSYVTAGDSPVTTFTYRERNNPNFQDPTLPAALIDPNYLNIRSLGDLLTIPMSAPQNLLLYSIAPDSTTDPKLAIQDSALGTIGPVNASLGSRSLYGKFSHQGNQVAYDDSSDVYSNDEKLTNQVSVQSGREHPSWGAGDTLMSYYSGNTLYVRNMITNSENVVMNNANFAPDITAATFAGLPFWGTHWNLSDLIGNAMFEMASPDISPSASNNEICFSQVDQSSTGNKFLDQNVAYNLASIKTDGSGYDIVTQNPLGTYDYAPDYSSDGTSIVYTRTTYAYFNFVAGFLGTEPIPSTSIWMVNRTGGGAVPLQSPWDVQILPFAPDPGIISIDLSNPATPTVTVHQPMFPSISSDGQTVAFMDCPVTFSFNFADPVPRPLTKVATGDASIYTMKVAQFQDWDTMTKINNPADPGQYETFPDLGAGTYRIAAQGDSQIGDVPGSPLPLPNASTTTAQPFTPGDKQLIAEDIGNASTALRRTIGWGADNQNWHFKDLPSVPEQTVDVLKQLADVACFRDATVTYDSVYQEPNPIPVPPPAIPPAPIQAYPGRININTADRAVLRTVFLNMFQGPTNDPDNDNAMDPPEPRIRDGGNSIYVNLMDPALDASPNGEQTRFKAMMVADRYAQQVVEYRKWIYNNQGALGVTDETVPSNLPLYELAFSGTSHYGNYRANPFYPMVDTNGDGIAPEVPRYNPEPPFRSIADLFNVMLYDNNKYPSDWTYDGIGGPGEPGPTYLPQAFDPNNPTGGATGSVNELTVWGPIYNTDAQRTVTHPTGPLGNGWLTGFASTVDNNFTDASNYNHFYEQQAFRLFSADDFRRIAPFLTVRTYDYRIESRGVVRVSSGAQRMDITRDKIWIVTTNTDAVYGVRTTPSWNVATNAQLYDPNFPNEYNWNTETVAQNVAPENHGIPLTGSVTFVAGGPPYIMSGNGTKFLTELKVGDLVGLDSDPVHLARILSVDSDTQCHLSTVYPGVAGASGPAFVLRNTESVQPYHTNVSRKRRSRGSR